MKLRRYFFLFYYCILIVVLQMQQSESMPSIVYRLAYLAAVMWPLYSVKREAMPVVLGLFYTITNYNFSYSYMPYEVYQYDVLIAFGLLLGYNKDAPISIKIPKFLIVWLVLISYIDLLTEYRISYISYSILGLILLWPYLKFGDEKQLRLMSLGLVVTGTVLAINFIVFGGQYAELYYGGGGFERQGWTDANYFGCVIGMGIVAAMVELLHGKNNLMLKTIYVTSTAVMFVCLAMNASRGAMLSVGLSSLVLVFLTKIKMIYKVLFTMLVIVLIIVMFNMGFFDLLLYRMESDSNGGSGRLTIWTRKLDAFFTDAHVLNYLFGMGQSGGRSLALDTHISTGFHNDFIAFFCEYGVIGLLLFIKWLYYPIKVACSNKWLVISVVVYIAACGLTLEPVSVGRFTYFIFWVYAFQLGVYQNIKYMKQ